MYKIGDTLYIQIIATDRNEWSSEMLDIYDNEIKGKYLKGVIGDNYGNEKYSVTITTTVGEFSGWALGTGIETIARGYTVKKINPLKDIIKQKRSEINDKRESEKKYQK